MIRAWLLIYSFPSLFIIMIFPSGSVNLWFCIAVALWLCASLALWLCALWPCYSVHLWPCSAVALWPCSAAALWPCGSVALWLCGSVALWLCGSTPQYHCGSVAPSLRAYVGSQMMQFAPRMIVGGFCYLVIIIIACVTAKLNCLVVTINIFYMLLIS